MLVDQREQFHVRRNETRVEANREALYTMQRKGVLAEGRTLGVGDVMWVARNRRKTGEEYCLVRPRLPLCAEAWAGLWVSSLFSWVEVEAPAAF